MHHSVYLDSDREHFCLNHTVELGWNFVTHFKSIHQYNFFPSGFGGTTAYCPAVSQLTYETY